MESGTEGGGGGGADRDEDGVDDVCDNCPDLANPDQSAARRIRTSVPQQSLFMMNSSFVIGQAKQLVSSIAEFENLESAVRIEKLYRKILQRDPDQSELEIGLEFIADAAPTSGENQLGPWQRYAQLLMFTNEFEFVD